MDFDQTKRYQLGFLTLEILLAMTIMIIALSATVLTSFGGQSLAADSRANSEAFNCVQNLLERTLAQSSIDFNSTSLAISTNGIYQEKLIVNYSSPCEKKLIGECSWDTFGGRTQSVQSPTIAVSLKSALAYGINCAYGLPSSNAWINPVIQSSLDIGAQISGISIKKNIAFITSSDSGEAKNDFWVVDVSDASNPKFVKSIDITLAGLNGIILNEKGNYAYVINNNNSTTTLPYNQLQIVDISDASNPSFSGSVDLPGVSGECPYSCPQGRSVFYYDNTIYVGLHRVSGPDFFIYDVSNPKIPVLKGCKKLDHNVNDIFVRSQTVGGILKKVAFLALSDNSGELQALDVSNPDSGNCPNKAKDASNIPVIAIGDAPEDEDGIGLYAIGGKLFLGRQRSVSHSDLVIFDISNLMSGKPISVIGEKNLGLKGGETVIKKVIVTGNLIFTGTTDENSSFAVWDTINQGIISRLDKNGNLVKDEIGCFDYDGKYIYAGFNSGILRIIKSGF